MFGSPPGNYEPGGGSPRDPAAWSPSSRDAPAAPTRSSQVSGGKPSGEHFLPANQPPAPVPAARLVRRPELTG